MQYLFLNGRAIRDRALQHALGEAYRGLMLTGRQPICFLRLEMPAELVDVNVHPTKQEVRFQDSGRLYSQLLGTLRTKFLTTDLTATGTTPMRPARRSRARQTRATAGPSELVALGQAAIGSAGCERDGSVPSGCVRGSSYGVASIPAGEPLRLHRLDVPPLQAVAICSDFAIRTAAAGEPTMDGPIASQASIDATTADARGIPLGSRAAQHVRNALQVHNRYLVVETDAGIEVIDQHALHERILYEQIREKVLGGRAGVAEAAGAGAGGPGGERGGGRAGARRTAGSTGRRGAAVWRRDGAGFELPGDAGELEPGRGAPRIGGEAARRRPAARTRGTCWTSCCT